MGLLMDVNVGVVILNVVLLSALLIVYGRMLREISTRLTWGLFAFAAVLWTQNAVQLYFYATMMAYFTTGVEPLVLTQNLLATAASALLLAATLVPVGEAPEAQSA